MDSLSQALLGAATFAIVKDKYIGKKSLIIGAVVGTIPDLDIFFGAFFQRSSFYHNTPKYISFVNFCYLH